MVDDRVKRAVGVLRGAETMNTKIALALETFRKCERKAAIADAGLAGQQHGLALALSSLQPTAQHEFVLVFAADEGGHSARVQRLEAAG